MNWKTQPRTAGIYIVAEVAVALSRENGVLAAGESLQAGTVLGKLTATGEYAQFDPAANDGSQNAAAILYASKDATDAAQPIVVSARLTAVTGDELIWPDGIAEPDKDAAIAALAANFVIVR